MGELFLLGILAIIVAILFNWGSPRFAATSWGARFQGSYAGRTVATALVFFLAIWVGAFALAKVGESPLRG